MTLTQFIAALEAEAAAKGILGSAYAEFNAALSVSVEPVHSRIGNRKPTYRVTFQAQRQACLPRHRRGCALSAAAIPVPLPKEFSSCSTATSPFSAPMLSLRRAGLLDVIAFVLCTIQMPLQRVGASMADIRANGADAKALFGSKRPGYIYARDHIEVLHAAVVAAVAHGDVVGAVDVLLAIPGLGVVKASFVAQICGLEVACLDTHNLRALGMKETALRLPKGLKAKPSWRASARMWRFAPRAAVPPIGGTSGARLLRDRATTAACRQRTRCQRITLLVSWRELNRSAASRELNRK